MRNKVKNINQETKEIAEAIGQEADRADNYANALSFGDHKTEVEIQKLAFAEISERLKSAYVRLTGNNPWILPKNAEAKEGQR